MRTSPLLTFGRLLEPAEAIEPILAKPVRDALLEWMTEIWAADELKAVGVPPRKRAIFGEPPGVGKTTLAHHLAARLGLPLLAVQADRIVDKYVGSSAQNMGSLFDAAEAAAGAGSPVLLFLDEFDSIASRRMNSGSNPAVEQGHNHMVNTLLRRLDGFDGFVIAATNLIDQVDEAVWRRFEIQITLDLPGQGERVRILDRYLSPYGLAPREREALGEAMATASPALMRSFCETLKRTLIVGPKCAWDMDREAVFSRVLASVGPHPGMGKPRLWSHRAADQAVMGLRWPLRLATEIADEIPPVAAEPPPGENGGGIINFTAGRRKAGTTTGG